jgi:hypothetical protein
MSVRTSAEAEMENDKEEEVERTHTRQTRRCYAEEAPNLPADAANFPGQ